MTMKPFVFLALACSLASAQASEKIAKGPNPVVSARAQQIHDSALVIDTHADTPQRFLDEGFDIGSTGPDDDGLFDSRH